MYSSSTSSAYPSRRAAPPPSSVMSSHRRDERTANGPLTSERAMMEQIRSKLEKTQRRLARDHARATSQHGYNSSNGAPIGSTGVGSSRTQYYGTSSRTVASSRANVHSHGGSSHYFPPDYRSARAPAVQSVYLEDLGMGIHASQRTALPSRAPTSYAPGGGGRGGLRGGPPSNAPSYYAPPIEERKRSQTARSQHHHVHSERRGAEEHHHHRHQSINVPSRSHHHHHHESRHDREAHHHSYALPPSTMHRAPQERQPSRDAPPTSLRGILRTSSSTSTPQPPPSTSFVSSNMLHYLPPSSKQRLGADGQPERRALKHQPSYPEYYYINENDDDDDEVPAPPSSRVRFQDELVEEPPMSSLPLVEEDEEESDEEDTRHAHHHMRPEPVIQVKHTQAMPTQGADENTVETTPSRKTKKTMPTSPVGDKDPHPRRRRGSSASRATPPTRSPVGSGHTRKSLTSNPIPPKSDIDTSYFDQLDLRPGRGTKDRRSSVDVGDVSGLVKLSSSPIEVPPVPEAIGSKKEKETDDVSDSQAEDDSDDSAPSVPPADVLPSNLTTRDSAKSSPSSSSEYVDARAFADEEEVDSDDQVKAAVIVATKSNEKTDAEGESTTGDAPKTKPAVMNFWEIPSESDDSNDEVDREPSSLTFDDEYDTTHVGDSTPFDTQEPASPAAAASVLSPPSSPDSPPPASSTMQRRSTAASVVAANVAPSPRRHHDTLGRPHTKHHPMPLSQTMMLIPPPPPTSTAASHRPPPTSTAASHRPPPSSTYIRPSPGTGRASITSRSSVTAVPRPPMTGEPGSTYVPRRLRPKHQVSQLRKTLPPSIGALSGLASGPVTFELHEESFYEVIWQSGEFGFSFQRVYLEDAYDSEDDDLYSGTAPRSRRMFLRMLLNTERGTCASFKQVHVGDVLIQVGDTRVCDLQLDHQTALTKFFTQLRDKTPLRLVFQRMDPMSWEGGVEL